MIPIQLISYYFFIFVVFILLTKHDLNTLINFLKPKLKLSSTYREKRKLLSLLDKH